MKKKILKLITAWALILCMTVPTMLSVQAEGDVVGDAIDKETFVVQHHSLIDGYRNDGFTAPDAPAGYSDYLFAGWYADEDCETACDSTVSGEAYAKYVHKDVLGVKAQIKSATYFGTETSDIRFVSTVDSLDYQQVGFNITMYGTMTPYTTDTVYKQLYAWIGTEDVLTTYKPDLFHETSIRFFACTVKGVTNDAFDYGIQVQPFWVTSDGTTVTADPVTKSVSNGYMYKAMDADVTEVGTIVLDEDKNYALKGGSLGGKYYYLVSNNAADTTVYRLAQNTDGTWNTTENEYKSENHTGITASDITYNGKDGNLVMVSGAAVSYVDRSALTALDASATVGFDVESIKYNKNHDKYVTMLADGTVKVLDSTFAETGVATTVPIDLNGYTAQSVTADDSYIFQAFSKDTDGVISNKIAVYDWSGKYVATIVVALTDKTIETIDINKNTISAACTTDAGVVICDIDILKTYDIVYKNIDDRTTVGQKGYTKNSGEIAIEAPERYGYDFLGWSEETVSLSDVTWRDGLANESDGNTISTNASWANAKNTGGLHLADGLKHTLMYGSETYKTSLSALRWRLFQTSALTLSEEEQADIENSDLKTSFGTADFTMEVVKEVEGVETNVAYPYAVLSLQKPGDVDLDKLSIKSEFVKPLTLNYTVDETKTTVVLDNFTKGFINTGAWSVQFNHNSYPDAVYSDEIELKGGVKYTLTNTLGSGIRWRLIAEDGNVSNASNSGTYTPEEDCTVRVMLLAGRSEYTNAVIKAGSTGDRTYTATWIRNSFKVQYNANGGEGTMEDSIHEFEDDKQLSANAFTNEGYGFAGWSTSPEGEVVYADQEAVKNLTTDESITLYAQWSPSFSINYEYGEGAVAPAEGNPTSYTVKTPSFTLNEPTKEGYDFAGWTETISLNDVWTLGGIAEDSGEVQDLSSTTYNHRYYSDYIYLQKGRTYTFNKNDYSSSTDSNIVRWRLYNLDKTYANVTTGTGGTTYTPENDYYVRIYILRASEEAERNSITLTSSASSITVDQGTTGNRTYTANWELPTYNCTVAYNSNAPEGLEAVGTMENSSHVNGVASTLSANAYAVEGYAFTGWNTAADGTGTTYGNGATVTELATSANEAVTLYAQWTNVDVFDIKYELDGGTLVDGGVNPTSYAATTESFTLTEPTREGYTFTGWEETISFSSWTSGTIAEQTGEISDHESRYYSNLIYLQRERKYTFVYPEDYATTTSSIVRWRLWDTSLQYVYKSSGTGGVTYTPDDNYYVRILLLKASEPEIRESIKITSNTLENSNPTILTIDKGTTGNITYTALWTQNATE